MKNPILGCGLFVAISLSSLTVAAVERSCHGRIYAVHLESGYEIDIVNHFVATASASSANLARGVASQELQRCAQYWWSYRSLYKGVKEVRALLLHCLSSTDVEIKDLSPAQVDIEARLKALACSSTYAGARADGGFHLALHVETWGDNGCGAPKSDHKLLQAIYSLDACSPMRILGK